MFVCEKKKSDVKSSEAHMTSDWKEVIVKLIPVHMFCEDCKPSSFGLGSVRGTSHCKIFESVSLQMSCLEALDFK